LQFEPRTSSNSAKRSPEIEALGHDGIRGVRWTDTARRWWSIRPDAGAELEANKREVRVPGDRISAANGQAGFAHLQGSASASSVCEKDVVGERGFELFHLLDLGIRLECVATCSNEDQRAVYLGSRSCSSFEALLPLPGKMARLTDVELRTGRDIWTDRQ